MDTIDLGRLTYLVILGSAVLFWFVTQNRQSMSKTLQQAMAWGLIFLGVIAAYGLWSDIRRTVRPDQTIVTADNRVEVPRSADGHYYMTLRVNDAPVTFMVDTGASQVVLTRSDAERVGLDADNLAYTGRAMTANGEVRTAPVRLQSIGLGPLQDTNIRAWVNDGDMDQSLLGMSYLQRWSRIEIANGALVLTR